MGNPVNMHEVAVVAWVLAFMCVAPSRCLAAPNADRPTWEALEQALMEQQQWMNNTIGITDQVPAPWEPIRIEPQGGNHTFFHVLGRRYVFNRSLLPSAIDSWRQPVLAGPITLTFVTDRAHAVAGDGLIVLENGPNQIKFLTHGSTGGVHVACEQTLEYDGMLLCRLTIRPLAEPVALRRLSIRTPVLKRCAKYLNYNNFFQFFPDTGNRNTMGLIPELPLKLSFRPSVWLGNEDVGLDWFAESDQGWDRQANLDRQIEIFDEGEARVLQVNIINSPLTLDAVRTIVFGYIATPPKPVKPDWHTNPALFDYSMRFVWDDPPYNPVPSKDFLAKGGLAASLTNRDAFKTSFTYMGGIRADGSVVPEKYLWGQTWRQISPTGRLALGQPVAPKDYIQDWRGSPMSAQTDWLLWQWRNLIRQHGIRDIYFDSLGFPDINPLHGAGYVDENGIRQPTVAILAMRRALQRFYVMCGELLPEFNLSVHGGSASLPPVLSFAHAHVSGEHLICDPRRVGAHYSSVVPPEEWIGYFMGRQFGVVGVFLPELDDRYRTLREPTEEMVMLTLLHDMPVIAAFCNVGIVTRTRAVLKDFGLAGMRFVPYWDSGRFTACANPDIKISLYHDDTRKRAVLIVGNTGATHAQVEIELKPSLLTGGAFTLADLCHGESLIAANRFVKFPIKALNFRLIAIIPD